MVQKMREDILLTSLFRICKLELKSSFPVVDFDCAFVFG